MFAIGVSLGMTKDRDGASAIAGLVAFLTLITLLSPGVVSNLTKTPVEEVNIAFNQAGNGNVFFGLIAGVVALRSITDLAGRAYHKPLRSSQVDD